MYAKIVPKDGACAPIFQKRFCFKLCMFIDLQNSTYVTFIFQLKCQKVWEYGVCNISHIAKQFYQKRCARKNWKRHKNILWIPYRPLNLSKKDFTVI